MTDKIVNKLQEINDSLKYLRGAVEGIVENVFLSKKKQQQNPSEDDETGRNPANDKQLTNDEIERLKEGGEDIHELKGGRHAAHRDLYKDAEGNIYVKPKGGRGPGEPTGLNINDF